MRSPAPTIVGIIDVTPGSFSDGGLWLTPERAIAHAEALHAAGASIIEVGGDSTRPGSTCVGPDVEWSRIEKIAAALAPRFKLSVDTHHGAVAARALELGAVMINDVTAGSDPALLRAAAQAKCSLVLMFSRCSPPHFFGPSPGGDIVQAITSYLDLRTALAIEAGVLPELIVRDTGMGGFLSGEPSASWEVLRRYNEIIPGGGGLMFGSSRKGFLKSLTESSPLDRDHASAVTGALAALKMRASSTPLFIRTHNPALQLAVLRSFSGGIPQA